MVAAPLTLRSIQTRAVEVPMARPLGTSAQTMNSAPILLIDMQTEEGIVGRAYLFCYTRMAPGLIATVLADIADGVARRTHRADRFLEPPAATLSAVRGAGHHPHGAGRLRRGLLGRAVPGRRNAAGQLHRIPTAAHPSLQQQRPRPDAAGGGGRRGGDAARRRDSARSSCASGGRRRRPIWPWCAPSAAACPTASR